jgi:hypothetical protein
MSATVSEDADEVYGVIEAELGGAGCEIGGVRAVADEADVQVMAACGEKTGSLQQHALAFD